MGNTFHNKRLPTGTVNAPDLSSQRDGFQNSPQWG
jgi:hypothetical protein